MFIFWSTGKKIAVVLVILMIAGAIGAMYFHYIPNPIFPYQSPEYPGVQLLDTEQGIALFESATTEEMPFELSDLENLNFKIYGVNGFTSSEIITWYKEVLSDWTEVYYAFNGGEDWEYRIYGFSRLLTGQVIGVYSGTVISENTEYDSFLFTSNGLITDYFEIMET